MPKKPLTPYFRYFLEKREKYSKDNPDMSMTDLAKLLSKKFQQLPDKKKVIVLILAYIYIFYFAAINFYYVALFIIIVICSASILYDLPQNKYFIFILSCSMF